MRDARLPGEVTLSIIVGSDGSVAHAEVLESTHPDFEASALEAVMQWHYAAGTKGGKPVNTRLHLPIVFAFQNLNWF